MKLKTSERVKERGSERVRDGDRGWRWDWDWSWVWNLVNFAWLWPAAKNYSKTY